MASRPSAAERREMFLRRQRERLDLDFSLTAGEAEARASFEQLAIDSYDYLQSKGEFLSSFGLYAGHDYAGWTSRYPDVPPSLIARWQEWNGECAAIYARSPRLALRDMIHQCSETHDFTSWPAGWSADIFHWLDGGVWSAPPFDDRKRIVTETFFLTMRELVRRSGGWIEDGRSGYVVVPEAEARKMPRWFGRTTNTLARDPSSKDPARRSAIIRIYEDENERDKSISPHPTRHDPE